MSSPEDFLTITEKMFELYRAGKYDQALDLVEKKAAAFPEQAARVTFWRICLLSRCKREEAALTALAQGLDAGLWWHESQFLDADLDPLRDMPAFKSLTVRSQERWTEEQARVKPERTVLVPAGIGSYPLLIALHGYSGNKDSNLDKWETACHHGWMVLSPQSRKPLYPGAYFWDTPRAGIADILFHLDEVRRSYRIDAGRIVLGGFSQGGGMAVLAALSAQVPAVGFISVGTWWGEMDAINSAIKGAKPCRGYFINGLNDNTLERTREIQAALKANQIPFDAELHADIGHEFPADFEKSFEKALRFLLL